MKKIIINPHNCSREEYEELKKYLDDNCWDYCQLHDDTINVDTFKGTLDEIIDLAKDVVRLMPSKGNTKAECQRATVLQALNEFSYTVNGIEKEDLISDKEIDLFKENWGQSHEEICSNLGYDEEDSDDVLRDDYFWDSEDDLWLNKHSSLFSEREKEIANYLRFK